MSGRERKWVGAHESSSGVGYEYWINLDLPSHESAEDEYLHSLNGHSEEIGMADILLALDSLTERQRFVVECRYGMRPGMSGERLSTREIASLMGVHHSTVQEHETAALAALRRAFD